MFVSHEDSGPVNRRDRWCYQNQGTNGGRIRTVFSRRSSTSHCHQLCSCFCVCLWWFSFLRHQQYTEAQPSPAPSINPMSAPVRLIVEDEQVVLDNGLLQLTLSNPGGFVTAISYNGLDNLLEVTDEDDNRGYWDLVWEEPGVKGTFYKIHATEFRVIMETEDQVELSFSKVWDATVNNGSSVPLDIDKRFIMLRGKSGFYTYGFYEHKEGWPDFDMAEARVVFKPSKDKFTYMAVSDSRQRIMPTSDDRLPPRGEELAYPEAVRLIDPINPDLRGEVDDKYQYSCEDKDIQVHGWECFDPPTGFWMINPSDEYRSGGPLRQDLTSHTGPTTLAMFISRHYAGDQLMPKFRDGEYWNKVFGPIFIYLNSVDDQDYQTVSLWDDAKFQMQAERNNWPYEFPALEEYAKEEDRGSVTGRLFIRDRYIIDYDMPTNDAFVGVAIPGEAGSWQRESKGYQFWTTTDDDGYFFIKNVRAGEYDLYAFVTGFIGDYRYEFTITITPGCSIDLGDLVYEPPRDGPTLWEIGFPDRSAEEYYVPDPNPMYINKLYVDHPDKFRQYGLWERYTDLYPEEDLAYTIGVSDYRYDWFYAHVSRKKDNCTDSYLPATWQIIFTLDYVLNKGPYMLRLATASAANAELEVRFNNITATPAHFITGLIGQDNTIARHGIHGQYRLFHAEVKSCWLVLGENRIFLTQTRRDNPFEGIMYDYIRLEEPEIT